MRNKILLDNRSLMTLVSLSIWIRPVSVFSQIGGTVLKINPRTSARHHPKKQRKDLEEVQEMRSLRITLCFTVLLMLSGKLFAQAGATGTILGTVTDASGAIVSNAKV